MNEGLCVTSLVWLEVDCFPVLKEGYCIGFTTRARLQAAVEVWQVSGVVDSPGARPKADMCHMCRVWTRGRPCRKWAGSRWAN